MQVMVNELASIVGMKAFDGEWQAVLNATQQLMNAALSFVPDGPVLCPARENICKSKAPDELSFQGTTTMGHGVRLNESWFGNIIVANFDGDIALEIIPMLGSGKPSGAVFMAHNPKHSVKRSGSDL